MLTPRCRILSLAAFVFVLCPFVARSQTPVPYTIVNIQGTALADDTFVESYRAYQNAGDKYRILCQEPCTADQDAIYGLYAGFGPAYQQVVALFGVEAATSMQPFDLHVIEDHWCGSETAAGHPGDSFYYPSYSGLSSGSYGCFWLTDPGKILPFQYPDTETAAYQLLPAHEFTHTMFFKRHFDSYEDFAKGISFYFAGNFPDPPITDPCDDHLNLLNQGKLLWVLCHANGFQYANLATPFQALDQLYQTNQGTGYPPGATSVFQFHQRLNAALGSDTADAFLASKFVNPSNVGDTATMKHAGGRTNPISGWASLLLAPNAVATNTPYHIESPYVLSGALPPGVWEFANVYKISRPNGKDFSFEDPVYFEFKYDPYSFSQTTDESTLQLYRYDSTSNAWLLVSGSRVDPDKMTIGAPITKTGSYAAAAASTTALSTWVIPRVASSASVRTEVVLFNPAGTSQSGTLVFHPQGAAASSSDPSLSYSLTSNQTLVLPDVVTSIGGSGTGTVEIVSSSGLVPDVSVHFIELGTSGYPGAIGAAYPKYAALNPGDRGVLISPGNATQETFQFLVRTLGAGVSLTVTSRDTSGAVTATTSLPYAADTLFQIDPTVFNGGASVPTNQTFDVQIVSGNAFFLTETTESGMATTNIQPAVRYEPLASGTGDTLDIPKATRGTGADGSTLRTAVQLFNPNSTTLTGKVVFKPAGGGAKTGFNYSLAAGASRLYADPIGALGKSGPGVIIIESTSGPLPAAFARVIHAGASTPFQAASVPASDVFDRLRAGDRATLVAPDAASLSNYSIGVRTFQKDLMLTITAYFPLGSFETRITKTIPASTTIDTDIATWLGVSPSGGDVVQINVDSGSGIIYGTTVNPSTGALNYQPTKRLPFNYY